MNILTYYILKACSRILLSEECWLLPVPLIRSPFFLIRLESIQRSYIKEHPALK